MIKKVITAVFFIMFLFTNIGCVEYLTTIKMTPEKEKLTRNIKVSDEDPKREEVLKYYKISDVNSHDNINTTVSGNFKNHMEGNGSFNSIQTSLGSSNFYSENFLGTTDFVENLEVLDKRIDKGIHLVMGWLRQNLGNTPQYSQLEKFLKSDFKKDVKNMFLMFQIHVFNVDLLDTLEHNKTINKNTLEVQSQEYGVRMLQYVIEKEYCIPEKDIPLLNRNTGKALGTLNDSGDIHVIVQTIVRENLKRRFGYTDEQIMPALDPNGFKAYIQKDSSFVQFQEEQRTQKKDPNHIADIEEYLVYYFDAAKFSIFSSDNDRIDMELLTGTEPLDTNGTWDPNSGMISWKSKRIGRGSIIRLPEIVYAFWVHPDIKFQEKHFGKVLVEKSDLCEYCMWYAALDKQDSKDWNNFLMSLNPCADPNTDMNSQLIYLKKTINSYEFSEIKDADIVEKREAYRKIGKDIILKNLVK